MIDVVVCPCFFNVFVLYVHMSQKKCRGTAEYSYGVSPWTDPAPVTNVDGQIFDSNACSPAGQIRLIYQR